MVLPNAKLSGSTSVLCILSGLVYGSLLILVNGSLANATSVYERTNNRERINEAMATPDHRNRGIRDIVVPPYKFTTVLKTLNNSRHSSSTVSYHWGKDTSHINSNMEC